MNFWQEIPFVRLAYTYQCREELHLPPYKGSALRGAFGHALKKVTCALRRASCDNCLLRDSCVYVYVFETPPPPDSRRLRLYPSVPHPFVLRPPADRQEQFQPGERLTGELILIGRAIDYLPYFVYALEVLGQEGLGRRRGKCDLLNVVELNSAYRPVEELFSAANGLLTSPSKAAWSWTKAKSEHAPDNPFDVELEFLTPIRLKANGRYLDQLEFHHLIRNLLRRLASLAYFHCGFDPEDFNFKESIALAETVDKTDSELHWLEWERYSARQRTRMLLGGLVGNIRFTQVPPQFYSLLVAGEQLHVGKAASFGLGQYKLSITN